MKPANYAPIYACVYAQLAEVARSHGYALAAHGSLAADFDLVCIPWVPGVSDPQSVVDEITSRFAIKQVGAPEQKKHGRIAYTISFEFGECRLDLSFMPTEAAQDQGEVQSLREAPVVVATAILGGLFHGGSGPELGEIDIEVCTPALEALQCETVNSSDDVFLPLMTVAQHERIVAALSAQQSEPERVSVPVELLGRITRKFGVRPYWDSLNQAQAINELRALLASHGRGEA